MEKYMSREDFDKELLDIEKEIQEINEGFEKLSITYENIETAQGIINSISKIANIVNATANPAEFFDGYEKMYYLVDKLESVPDIEYSQQPPNEIRIELQGQRKPAIRNMIRRYYNHVISMNGTADAFYNTISRYFPYMDDEHKNYINQLCKTANRNHSNGTTKIRKIKELYMNFSYFVNKVFFPPAKFIFVLWTLFWMIGTSSFLKDIPFILFGYIVLCGIADLVYFANQKKYTAYKIKITQKKINRLKLLMQETDPISYQKDYGNNNYQTAIKKIMIIWMDINLNISAQIF